MAKTPTYPLGLPDAMRERWETEAKKQGLSLAEFVRRAVEASIAAGSDLSGSPLATKGPHGRVRDADPMVGKFKGPDLKPSQKRPVEKKEVRGRGR